jgi:hypothetical protein
MCLEPPSVKRWLAFDRHHVPSVSGLRDTPEAQPDDPVLVMKANPAKLNLPGRPAR